MSDLLTNGTAWFPAVIVAAGFLTSLHCAGMCGPLIMAIARTRPQLTAYHLARALSYIGAGALAGGLANGVQSHAPSWIVWIAMLSMAALLIGVGVTKLTGRTFHLRPPAALGALQRQIFSFRLRMPTLAAACVGGLSVLLPCGHLYAFLAGAAATGSALKGAGLMGLFTVSTWPILFSSLGFFQKWLSIASRFRVSGVLFVLAGLMSLASFAIQYETAKANLPPAEAPLSCH